MNPDPLHVEPVHDECAPADDGGAWLGAVLLLLAFAAGALAGIAIGRAL